MVEDRESLLQHYRGTRAALLAAIDGLTGEQASQPSPDGWSVKDQLAHIAAWDELRAREIERISAGQESACHMTREHVQTMNNMLHELRRRLSSEQAKWELETSRQRVLDAIASASERGLDGSLYAELGLRSTHEVEHTDWIKRWRLEQSL